MLTRDKVNSIFGIKESYKLPEKLMTMLFDDPQKIYDALKDEDMGSDFFRDYFQECQGDRVAFKQDFTPDSIGKGKGVTDSNALTSYSVSSMSISSSVKISPVIGSKS